MNDSAFFKLKRIMKYLDFQKEKTDDQMMYLWILQNKLRIAFIKSLIIGINVAVLRRVFLPQFGVIVNGFWRNASVDLVLPVCYLNYFINFEMIRYSIVIDSLSESVSDNQNESLEFSKIGKQKAYNRKFLTESQFWH